MITETPTFAPASEPASLNESDFHYYGWRVALAACFGVMAGFGSLFVYTFTIFVKPLSAQFGWNREAISFGFAIAAMTVGLASPGIGRLIDRFGPRRIVLPSMTVFGCGIAIVVAPALRARWEPSMSGLPAAKGTTVSRFATHAGEPGVEREVFLAAYER